MKYFTTLFLLMLLFACQNKATQQAENPSTTPPKEVKEPEETVLNNTYCFVSSYGVDPAYQDTTAVKLTVIGDEITGTYNWIPAGKDSARGTLAGTIKNGIITAVYDYMIEGSSQKEEMIFKMEVNQLLVKKGELIEVGDMLKLKNPGAAKFSEVIPRVLCK